MSRQNHPQEVCPFNERFAASATEPGYAARGPGERPVGVEALPGERDFDSTDSAESRGRSDGNAGPKPIHPGIDGPPLTELLRTALSEDPEPLVRGHAVWALGQAGSLEARETLGWLLRSEDDPWVREIAAGLNQ